MNASNGGLKQNDLQRAESDLSRVLRIQVAQANVDPALDPFTCFCAKAEASANRDCESS